MARSAGIRHRQRELMVQMFRGSALQFDELELLDRLLTDGERRCLCGRSNNFGGRCVRRRT